MCGRRVQERGVTFGKIGEGNSVWKKGAREGSNHWHERK